VARRAGESFERVPNRGTYLDALRLLAGLELEPSGRHAGE
jgi:hypothetical protein